MFMSLTRKLLIFLLIYDICIFTEELSKITYFRDFHITISVVHTSRNLHYFSHQFTENLLSKPDLLRNFLYHMLSDYVTLLTL